MSCALSGGLGGAVAEGSPWRSTLPPPPRRGDSRACVRSGRTWNSPEPLHVLLFFFKRPSRLPFFADDGSQPRKFNYGNFPFFLLPLRACSVHRFQIRFTTVITYQIYTKNKPHLRATRFIGSIPSRCTYRV